MDKEKLTAYLKSEGRSASAINRSLHALDAFNLWLKVYRGTTIEGDINLEDLKDFIHSTKKGQKNLLLGLSGVFEYLGKEELQTAARQMRSEMLKKERKPMKLRDFLGVDHELIRALKEIGVHDAHQLLKTCPTPESRHTLADELYVSYQELLELVKMADLSRMFAVKAVRTRLYLESGYDTLDKLASSDAMTLHHAMVKFVDERNFNGIPTTPKEADFTVKEAKKLDRWIVFEEGE